MAIGPRALAFGSAVLLAGLAAGCGGGGSYSRGLFTARDVVARPGGGVLVLGYANARRGNSGHCHGRLVALALTSSGARDPRFGKGGVASLALGGADCLGDIEQSAGDAAGDAAIEVTLDRPGDCGDDGCSAHIPAAYLLSSRGRLREVAGTEHDGLGAIALEPGGGLALYGTRIFSFAGFGPRAPLRTATARVYGFFGRGAAVTPAGRVLALGLASSRPEDARIAVERLLPDLRPDPGWGRAGVAIVPIDPGRKVAYQPFPLALLPTPRGGAIMAVTPVTKGRADGILLALDASGRLDRRFGDGGRVVLPMRTHTSQALALAGAAGGRVYVSTATGGGPRCRSAILALGPDGRPARGFGHGGVATLAAPCAVTKLALAPDGSLAVLVAQGTLGDAVRILALRPDGSPDPGFGRRGALTVPALTIVR